MNRPHRVLPGALRWSLLAALASCPAWAADAAAEQDAARARYEAACSFIGDELERLDRMVARTAGGDELVRTDPGSGASLFRRQAGDLRIDYLITAGGKTMVSQAELGPAYLGGRVSAHALANRLRLPHKLPPTLHTECDRLALTVRSRGPRILGMRIDADID